MSIYPTSPISPIYFDFNHDDSLKLDYQDRNGTLGSVGSNLSECSNPFSSLAIKMAYDAIQTPTTDLISEASLNIILSNFEYPEEIEEKEPAAMVTPSPKSENNLSDF